MANFIPCLCLFRIALPVLITLCIIFRPSGLSAIYLLFLLYLPFVPVPTTHTMLGCTGIYLKMLIAASTLTAVTQLAFQIVLLSLPPYGEFLTYCETLEKILRHVGLVKLDGISATSAIAWLAPEVGMFIGSIAIYVLCSKLVAGRIAEDGEQGEVVPQIRTRKRSFSLFAAVGRYLSLIALCVAAVLRPSITGGIYFLVFLSAATWWACYKELRKGFAILTRCVCALVFIHICVLYAYQFQWPQEFLEQNSTYARYFGLTPMISVNCSDPRNFIWADVEWATYLNPIALLFLYYILAIESKLLLMPQVQKEKAIPGETSPLIRGVSPSRKYGAQSKRPANVLQDSTGSVTVTEGQDDIPMQQLGTTEEEYKPGLFENVVFALESIVQVIIRSSYIGTNIIMMAWSITYHSWITFVLLLWANILWMIPNQRRSMLYCSPLLVIYAWFLLLSAYIFSMDLTEAELPSVIDGVDFNQIGFVKITELPCVSLLVKCLYTTMFWITLRQFMKERQEARQSSTLADIVAPLQVTVGTATGVSKEQEKGSKILEIIGQVVKNFLTKFWIWAVAATLFAVAITGQRMTGFRIIYMALFLIFILSFQLSFRMWRKVMFGFWLTVIIYSMIILILVYTYQFKNFPRYWSEYLHVPKKQQEDIGLETYETKQLFIRLVTPTVFVVITVIQLHYFHKDFMEISNPKNNSIIETRSEAASSAQGAPWDPNSDKTDTTVRFDISEIGNVSSKHIQEFFRIWLIRIHKIINLIYLFLEIHMPKIVLFVAMLLCIYDKCAIYFLIILLLVLAFSFGRPVQIFAIYASSVLVSVLLLLRMIYQIEFVKHDAWNVTCYNLTNNTATWLGFNKTNGNSLPQLVRWNIIFIMVATVWSVVLVRQENYRIARGKPTTRAFFMFPKIKRADADKSVENCLKYLANFGFYKFGVEISLIATVALIGFRMDVYSVLYAIWLCILFSMDRSTLSKVWNFYLAFIAILLPIQYVMAIGLPPNICIDYPWKNDNILRRLQEWMFLMDIIYPPPVKKLLCDFILLLLVSRQSVAFRIERRNAGQDYPGGSNDTITQHAEEKDFINPVPDYVTYIRSYLDAFKRGVFLSFMWITLAIVFLAGTNRVSLFSIGYLGGSFVFLWHGSDLYLRPIPSILKLWNWLLGYNVVVIFIKTFLQFVGCVYAEQIMESTCWLVHLLAIGCVEKFEDITNKAGIVDPNKCAVPREYIGLAWDGVCFAFLILQRRIFNSYNFFHVVDETKATTILASRGAELIEELRDKRMTEQEEQERRILEKIKAKMDRIKANQQKIQGPSYKDSTNHFVAIRSGDYYMFDELDDEELDLIEDMKAEDDDEEEEKDTTEKRPGPRRRTVGEIAEHPSQERKALIDSESYDMDGEPKPGTSKDEEISELSEPRESIWQKVLNYILFVIAFINSSMVSLTNFLNKYSKDYRYVIKVLTKEKKILKEQTEYSVGVRLTGNKVWQPSGSYHALLKQSRRRESPADVSESYDEYEGAELSSVDQPTIIRLLLAIWYIILSHSDVLCYFMIFLNQIKSASFLSLPLPVMVFFWGTLTIPRPTKTFWVTIIAYTEVIVLIKCVCQIKLPWTDTDNVLNSPLYPPKIIGIERAKDYAIWDLVLLLIVFFHRFLLKCLGLWKSSYTVPAVISDGDYKIIGDELYPVAQSSQKSEILETGDSDTVQIYKGSPAGRTASDLQKLVEEPEEQDDDDDNEDKISDQENIVEVHSKEVDPCDHFRESFKITTSQYADSVKKFFRRLIDPSSRVAADVYSYMFLCDFFNFFVILIGYSSFGAQQGDGGVSSYLTDNRVPVLFLLMLILQFTLIIVDRAIFLRKYILGKIIFQFLQIFILHMWLFVLFPIMTERSFNSVIPPQMYYMVKCFYLLLSAYQIRCGYPSRILGNFLCKGYNYANYFLFKGFMAVPFLFELRTVMDWMWTDTSMTVFDWIKMEDIFSHIFQLKCTRYVESEYPQPRGEKKSPTIKYLMGGGVLAFIVAVIWFPLVFFSLGNAVGEPNIPFDVTVDVRIGPYEPIYTMSAQSNAISQFGDYQLKKLYDAYSINKPATTFISNYEAPDVAAVLLSSDSGTVWSISPPDRDRMLQEVNSTKTLTVRLQYVVSHKSNNKEDSGVIRKEIKIELDAKAPARKILLDMLLGSETAPPVPLTYIMPKFIKVTNRGTADPITILMDELNKTADSKYLRNLTLKLSQAKNSSVTAPRSWWEIHEECDDNNFKKYLVKIPYADLNCSSLIMYTFNDKIFPETLSIITAGGIIGLYTTLVFVASRVLRSFFSDICFKIMFDDMPNVDRVLQLCLDIYLVREANEFALEEDLFAKLVFLFRSPETLIKWTRPKEEIDDDDDDPEGGAQ